MSIVPAFSKSVTLPKRAKGNQMEWNKQDIVRDLKSSFGEIPRAVLHPFQFAKVIKSRSWINSTIHLLGLSAVSGFGFGIFQNSILSLLAGIFIFPLTCLIFSAISAVLIYYYFYFRYSKKYNLEFIFGSIAQTSFGFLMIHPLAGAAFKLSHTFSSFIDIVGLSFSALLLIVALVDSLRFPKKPTVRLITSVLGIILVLWIVKSVSQWLHQTDDNRVQNNNLNQLEETL